jgi:hypothetical protein
LADRLRILPPSRSRPAQLRRGQPALDALHQSGVGDGGSHDVDLAARQGQRTRAARPTSPARPPTGGSRLSGRRCSNSGQKRPGPRGGRCPRPSRTDVGPAVNPSSRPSFGKARPAQARGRPADRLRLPTWHHGIMIPEPRMGDVGLNGENLAAGKPRPIWKNRVAHPEPVRQVPGRVIRWTTRRVRASAAR